MTIFSTFYQQWFQEENKVSIDEQTALEEDLQKANRRAENAENDLVKLQRKHKELSEKYNEVLLSLPLPSYLLYFMP